MTFEARFRSCFGATPPLGYCLRADHATRWLRLHSLPASKRYADTDAERAEVRHRAFTAAAAVLRDAIWIVTPAYELETVRRLAPGLTFTPAGRYEHPLLDEPLDAHAAPTPWPHPDSAALVDEIASDATRALWFCAATGEVFAPYDGGIDLLAATPARAAALRATFPPDWFSRRPDGL